ncbi:unnamed protein product [Porites evermanni]|uniref:Homogentisate 1,2-dioxygenase n=1 Tax=Porites evermanni TaxID=104178 RepID=A0ABN8LSN5_9CNID|nr:unnamed protein product [Porites evermanni]
MPSGFTVISKFPGKLFKAIQHWRKSVWTFDRCQPLSLTLVITSITFNSALTLYWLNPFCSKESESLLVSCLFIEIDDPSIFTVLTCPTGVAIADFVIFPPGWTQPYVEWMWLISCASYANQQEEGFAPGGGSLHSMMTSHGPDKDCFEKVQVQS